MLGWSILSATLGTRICRRLYGEVWQVYSLRVEKRARKGTMAEIREKVLSALVTLAENNPLFREEAIDNLENTIRGWGFVLTAEEMEGVQAHHRLAGMSDADILRELVRLHRGLPGFPGALRR